MNPTRYDALPGKPFPGDPDRYPTRDELVAYLTDYARELPAVIWATGFTRDHSWIDVPVFNATGAPAHRRGVTASPGLYFLGLPWQHTRGSALLGWVADDAAFIVGQVASLAAAGPVVRPVAA